MARVDPRDRATARARELVRNRQAKPLNFQGRPHSDPLEHEPKPEARILTLADVAALPVEWLWSLWVPRGCITLMDGDPGLGKSTIALDMAARVSRGWAMPPAGGTASEPADVILLSAEDDLARTIRPRLDAVEADVSRVHALPAIRVGDGERPPALPFDLDAVEAAVRERHAALIVIDPIMAYLDDSVNAHKDQDVRRVLYRLSVMAEQTRVAVLIIRHLNKLSGAPAMYRGGGSIGVIGAARSALLVGRHPNEEGVRVLASNKSNLGPAPRSLTYQLETIGDVARIAWLGECDLRPDEILSHPGQARRKAEALEEAVEWLEGRLHGCEVDKGLLIEEAKRQDISEATLRRARRKLGVEGRQEGFGKGKRSFWRLPKPSNPGQVPANQDQLTPIGADTGKQGVSSNPGQVTSNGRDVTPIDADEYHTDDDADGVLV